MGKYIIELPDDEHLISWWTYIGTEDGKQHIDFHEVVKTPYKEPDPEAIKQEAYQRGLAEAWEAARKIVNMIGVKRADIFGYITYLSIMNKFSATEAIEKIRQYEQEQEEIKVGDEVQHRNHSDIKVIVLNKDADVITAIAVTNVPFACKVGEMYINRDAKDWKKTGKHYDIAEVIRKMQEGK